MKSPPLFAETELETEAESIEAIRKRVMGRLLLLARENFFMRVEKETRHLFDASTLRACGTLMPFIDVKGTRSTELARRMGVSRQAVRKTLKSLLEEGLVEYLEDPTDGRAFLVRFTRAGMQRMADMHAAIQRVETALDEELGEEHMRITREVLLQLAYGSERRET